MNKKSIIGTSILAISLVLGAVGNASAGGKPPAELACTDVPAADACSVELDALCAAIEGGATPPLKARDKNTMISKDIGAAEKINQDKKDDALTKLGQILSKVDELENAPKTKIAQGDADAIGDAAMAAVTCVTLSL